MVTNRLTYIANGFITSPWKFILIMFIIFSGNEKNFSMDSTSSYTFPSFGKIKKITKILGFHLLFKTANADINNTESNSIFDRNVQMQQNINFTPILLISPYTPINQNETISAFPQNNTTDNNDEFIWDNNGFNNSTNSTNSSDLNSNNEDSYEDDDIQSDDDEDIFVNSENKPSNNTTSLPDLNASLSNPIKTNNTDVIDDSASSIESTGNIQNNQEDQYSDQEDDNKNNEDSDEDEDSQNDGDKDEDDNSQDDDDIFVNNENKPSNNTVILPDLNSILSNPIKTNNTDVIDDSASSIQSTGNIQNNQEDQDSDQEDDHEDDDSQSDDDEDILYEEVSLKNSGRNLKTVNRSKNKPTKKPINNSTKIIEPIFNSTIRLMDPSMNNSSIKNSSNNSSHNESLCKNTNHSHNIGFLPIGHFNKHR